MEVEHDFTLEQPATQPEVSIAESLKAETPSLPPNPSLRQSGSLPEPVQQEATLKTEEKKSVGILDRLKSLNPKTRLGKAAQNAIGFARELVLLPLTIFTISAFLGGAAFYASKSLLISGSKSLSLSHEEPSTVDGRRITPSEVQASRKARNALITASALGLGHSMVLFGSLVGTFVDPFRAPASERVSRLAFSKLPAIVGAVQTKLKVSNLERVGNTLTEIRKFNNKIGELFKKLDLIPENNTKGEEL